MGAGVSLDRGSIPADRALSRLCSEEKLGKDDPAFADILNCNFGTTTSQQDVDQLEHAALPFCLRLMKNNLWTCNLPNFIQTILPLLEEIETRDPDTITTSNANRCNAGLFIFRVILKHMIASHKGPNFLTQVEGDVSKARAAQKSLLDGYFKRNTPSDDPSYSFNVCRILMSLCHIVEKRLTSATLTLHLEAISTLLVFASTQLYQPEIPSPFGVIDALIIPEEDAQSLCKALHDILIEMTIADTQYQTENILQEMTSLFSIPFQIMANSANYQHSWMELETRTALLILILFYRGPIMTSTLCKNRSLHACICKFDFLFCNSLQASDLGDENFNYFYAMLSNAQTSTHGSVRIQRESNVYDRKNNIGDQKHFEAPEFSFHLLAITMTRLVLQPAGAFLAYTWLLHNLSFQAFLLGNPDTFRSFMLQCMKSLDCENVSSDHAIAIAAIFLILSGKHVFHEHLHSQCIGEDAEWHTERDMDVANLASLLFSIMLRRLCQNWRRDRDEAVHRFFLSVMVNMAPHMQHLDLYVCQRLLRLLHSLIRQYFQLQAKIDTSVDFQASIRNEDNDDLEAFAETSCFIHIMLNVIYNILRYNKHDIASLYRQELFPPVIQFLHIVSNLAIMYCDMKLSQCAPAEKQTSSSVQHSLQHTISMFPSDLLKPIPVHQYIFEEDTSPQALSEHFLRIWRCVVQTANIFPVDHGYPLLHKP
eukprot:gene4217-8477_t